MRPGPCPASGRLASITSGDRGGCHHPGPLGSGTSFDAWMRYCPITAGWSYRQRKENDYE